MLAVRDLTKHFLRHGERRVVFEDLNLDLGRRGRLAVLGRNGQGKSTLIKILGGVLPPTSGSIRWDMSCSWPLGFTGAFQGGMTGVDNINFVARIYDRPRRRTVERVQEFAELGDALTIPVKYYSSGMRQRLAFGLSLAIEFDCYLIDEVIAVGDAKFRRKCEEELFERRGDRAFVIASHDLNFLKNTCQSAIIVENGRAKLFDDVSLAVDIYCALCEEETVMALSRRAEGPAKRSSAPVVAAVGGV
jgi:capsular polysaccharide transport system ATP-binding protein